MSLRDLITKWLIEEAFAISKLDAPPEARVAWSIGVSTPGAPGVRFSVLSPADRQDRVILAMGIAISPEHRSELERSKPTERVRAMHSILSKALAVCIDCKIAVQPSIVDPQSITINVEVFEEEIVKYGKPYFMRLLTRFLNTYLAIVSGFNEWFPVIQPSTRGKESTSFM
ncbi:MAG: DUF2299 family protein [Desulfurococcaceae archaeon]